METIRIHNSEVYFPIEMVERKGIGHPDTICDCIAEAVSVSLSNHYIKEFGSIFHYNVDKALLVGGNSQPSFKGGKIIQPIELFIAGRATTRIQNQIIPVEEIAISTAKDWLRKNIRFLDVEKHIKIIPKIRSGSNDLVELFHRIGKDRIPISNDTSFGVSFFPFTFLEEKVLQIEKLLNSKTTKKLFPFIGEDIKVMGVMLSGQLQFTIAIAMVDLFISHIGDYMTKITQVKNHIRSELSLPEAIIDINVADNFENESVYLTVTGTSAESGDDGQVGRGNRINGLITPYRPMSLEATAGKNPISHVGKIYNLFAFELSKAIYEMKYAEEAIVFIVSQIGKPITKPQLLDIRVKNQLVSDRQIQDLATQKLNEITSLWKKIIDSETPFEPYT
ncbi:MAG: methionine adenosyltransferase [Algoriphagus sp.]|nr:methionine adenosyltransferase [Algoriphagus sp.]